MSKREKTNPDGSHVTKHAVAHEPHEEKKSADTPDVAPGSKRKAEEEPERASPFHILPPDKLLALVTRALNVVPKSADGGARAAGSARVAPVH